MPIGSDKGFIVKPGFNPLAEQTSSPVALPNGAIWSWGKNDNGQVGVNNISGYSSPVQIGALTTWATTSPGGQFCLARKTDGTLWSWGLNNRGQLATNNTTNYSSPIQVGALTNWLDLCAGYNHILTRKTDGTLWVWGRDYKGMLGVGTSGVGKSSPVQVGALTTWSKVSAGMQFSMATNTSNELYVWGYNYYGNLGTSNTTDYSSPVQVGALTNWLTISAGNYFAAAIKTDGTLWMWGLNTQGQLGQGNSTTNYSSPVQVGALTTWSKVATGTDVTYAVKTDGTLWVWGNGSSGELGDGTQTSKSSPVQVGALTTWWNTFAGETFAIGVTTGGALWSWGYNFNGRLGVGNTTNYSSPVQIGALTTWNTELPTSGLTKGTPVIMKEA